MPMKKEEISDQIGDLRNEIFQQFASLDTKIDESNKKLDTIYLESKEIRKEIGYQNIILKTFEDNIKDVTLKKKSGVSSKIQLSIGGKFLGTGAQLIYEFDVNDHSYKEVLNKIKNLENVPLKLKNKAQKFLAE